MTRPLPPQRQKVMAVLTLLVLTGCVTRSQTLAEEISVARDCGAKHMNVAIGESMFGLERAQCVPLSQGVTPAEFMAEYQRIGAPL